MKTRIVFPDLEHWKSQVKCQSGCPVATDAGRYVQLIAEGRVEEAFLVARAPNPFASVCGRVCAAPCEDACRRGSIDAPISIRGLKRFVTERYGVESVRPDTQDRLR
ncbi:MAG TPA: 4Fe-4S ferredoxin, partial [Candidatus Polarisedimenticolia bacterium]|nr:4Fe-4S ferredoxin [Candidatus Polarisedimenticolia bacterium]